MINFRFFKFLINFINISCPLVRRVINLSNANLLNKKNVESEISSDLAWNLLNAKNISESKVTGFNFHNIYNQFELNDTVDEKDDNSLKFDVLDLQGIFSDKVLSVNLDEYIRYFVLEMVNYFYSADYEISVGLSEKIHEANNTYLSFEKIFISEDKKIHDDMKYLKLPLSFDLHKTPDLTEISYTYGAIIYCTWLFLQNNCNLFLQKNDSTLITYDLFLKYAKLINSNILHAYYDIFCKKFARNFYKIASVIEENGRLIIENNFLKINGYLNTLLLDFFTFVCHTSMANWETRDLHVYEHVIDKDHININSIKCKRDIN